MGPILKTLWSGSGNKAIAGFFVPLLGKLLGTGGVDVAAVDVTALTQGDMITALAVAFAVYYVSNKK